MAWRPRSVRARLTLWYACILALVLFVYAGSVYAFLSHRLRQEMDQTLRMDFEAAEEALARKGEGAHHEHEGDTRWIEVRSATGEILYRDGPEEPPLPPPKESGPRTESLTLADGERVRMLRGSYVVQGAPVRIRVARSETRLRRELAEFALGMGIGLPLAVGLLCAAGYVLARRTLAPVDRIVDQARSITAERLGDRLAVANPDDELGRLAATFNEVFQRLERSFEEMKRFTADAAHELRTPLTAMRSVGEVCLRDDRDEAAYREAIGSMLEEADRMARLVDALLVLARADGPGVVADPRRVDLAAFLRETVERVGVLAEERHQTFDVAVDDGLTATADPDLLRQAVTNVLDNAMRHSPDGAAITVRAVARDDEAVLEIVDRGEGIAPEHQGRIFERFYRADDARGRETGGAGLGLAIARWAVEAQGGRIGVESRPGAGATFVIALPRARRPDH